MARIVTLHDKPLAVRRRAAMIGLAVSWGLAVVFLALAIYSM